MEYLRAVALDEAPMSKELAFRLLQEFSTDKGQEAKRTAGKLQKQNKDATIITTPLTEREKEVLERVATGASNREIAGVLGLSEHTVKNHLKNILQKLHLDNRVQLTRYALEQGLIER
jgi:DNA-binding NarL/FixJ family response regulator